MSTFFSVLKYIVLSMIKSNIIDYVKIILFSGLILGSGIIYQYAVSNEYYTMVKPLEHDTWDIVVDYNGIVNDLYTYLRKEGYAQNADTRDIGDIVLETISGSLNGYIVHASKIYSIPTGGNLSTDIISSYGLFIQQKISNTRLYKL